MKAVEWFTANPRRYLIVLTLAAFVAGAVFWQYLGRRTDAQSAPPADATQTVAVETPAAAEPPQEANGNTPEPEPPASAAAEEAAPAQAETPAPAVPAADQANALTVADLEVEDITDEETQFRMDFSDSINIETLNSFLSATDNRKSAIAITVEGASPSSSVLLKLPKSASLPLTITLKEGMPNAANSLTSAGEGSFVYPSPIALKVKPGKWESGDEGQNRVLLNFSVPVQRTLLERWVTFSSDQDETEIPFSIEQEGMITDAYFLLEGDLSAVPAIRVSIDTGLPGKGLAVLKEAFSATLKRASQPLVMANHWWDDRGVEGAALSLDLNVHVKPDEFLKHLSVEPPVANLRAETSYGNTLRLIGDWRSETVHRLTVSEGLEDAFGAVCVTKATGITLEKSPELKGVGFGQEGKLYIPRRGLGQLTAMARNVTKAKLNLWQVFPNNLIPALERTNNGLAGSDFNDRLAKLAGSKTIEFPPIADTRNAVPINITEMLPAEQRGVFTLQFEDARDWENTKVVLWTDIGVLSHWVNDELAVFAHNLFSLAPLAQAKVTVYSQKNQMMGTATTDAQGVALLTNMDTTLGRPRLVVVETDNDYTFLALDRRDDDPTAFDANMPAYDGKGYDAFLYADRTLYRPGETVHARWLVRTNYGDALADVPLELRLMNPKNQKILTHPVTLSALGSGNLDLATEKTYLTGRYTLELRVPGAQTALGSMTFNLEEFVPNRIKAEVTLDQDRWVANTPYDIKVNAQHLFGTPASNRKCETKVILRRGQFKSNAWREFHFGNDTEYNPEVTSLGEVQTDDAGNAAFSYTYAPNPKVTFPVEVAVRGEVFEMGGRSVTDVKDAVLFPSDVCLGIGASAGENDTVEVFAAAMRPDETPASLPSVKVTLEKQVWNYYVRRYSGYNEPNWTRSFKEIETREAPLTNGRGSVSFKIDDYYGYYRVRVHSDATPQFSTLAFYKYWRGFELAESARPSLIKLTLDKKEYNIGDEAAARIESPFDGRGMVVVQGEHIHKVLPIDVVNGVAEVRLGLLREYYPNVWLEATVVHEVKPERIGVYPFSSFAMANIPLRDPMRRIQIAYPGLPQEMRPNQEIEIQVETKDAAGQPLPAEITLAAVDEGIHDILDYQDPDPAAWFERSRKPDYRRAHYYDKVAYDFEGQPIGGDMIARRLGKGNADIDENWIKPVALWSGAVQTDASGHAAVKFQVPEFNGQLRLVAVAASASATGAHSEKMFVRRPYILRTSMPRFVLPGDRFKCGAVILNTTDAPCTARLHWKVSGALASGEGRQELALAAKAEASARPDFAAGPVMGKGEIQWNLEIVGPDGQIVETISEPAALPVRPPSVYQQDHQFTAVEPGQSLTFKNIKFIEDPALENSIVVSANPFIRLTDAIRWIVGYPYGCVEQTTSRCLPMYALRKAVAMADVSGMDGERIHNYIEAGINRLFSMQTPAGGLGYWPYDTKAYAYGSVYACHFLTMVHRDREYSLPEEEFKRLQDYVRNTAKDSNDDSLSGRHLRAYALYVLALDGDLEALQQIPRFDSKPLPRASRYLLAAALALNTQDPARVQTYLDTAPVEEFTKREASGTLNSEIRNAALELIALLHMKAPQDKLREKVTPLAHYLENRAYYTTQEVAFVATAVGLYLTNIQTNIDLAGGTVVLPDKEVQLAGSQAVSGKHEGPCSFTVNNTGQSPLFVDFTTAGIPVQPDLIALEKGISISRAFRKENGEPIKEPAFKQGETYLIDLQLKSIGPLENIIVADLLPAGLEIENPRLDADALAGQDLTGALTPSYLEIRDDRLVAAFNEMPGGEQHYYYLVRAVTPGTFQYPAARAECMYDPEVRAANVPAVANIE